MKKRTIIWVMIILLILGLIYLFKTDAIKISGNIIMGGQDEQDEIPTPEEIAEMPAYQPGMTYKEYNEYCEQAPPEECMTFEEQEEVKNVFPEACIELTTEECIEYCKKHIKECENYNPLELEKPIDELD